MPTALDALLQSILQQEEEDRPTADAKVEAALADPSLRLVIERVVQRYERTFTPKGMERARRTLAVFFTTDPRAASLLATMREKGKSGAVQTGAPANRRRTKP